MNANFNSPLLDSAVDELAKLPGIGRKTALRLALHLLRREEQTALDLGNAIIKMRSEIRYCSRCHNISEQPLCPICSSSRRDQKTICVVENVKDVITVESTGQHHGLYHVVGPSDIEIDSLVSRVRDEQPSEIILALSPTMEGDTTSYYIFRRLESLPVKITMLARGLSLGGELDYTDELTLGRSIVNRIPFAGTADK